MLFVIDHILFRFQMSKKNNYHDVAFWEQRYKQNIC